MRCWQSVRGPTTRPPPDPPAPAAPGAASAAAAPALVAPERKFQLASSFSQTAATAEQKAALSAGAAGNRSQQAKAEQERLAEGAANKKPIGRPEKLVSQYGCGDTAGAQLLCTGALALMGGKLCGREKMSGRRRRG